jgi:FixJ family two-component response regulator
MTFTPSPSRTILYLEDNASVRAAITESLQARGFEVHGFDSATALLAALPTLSGDPRRACIGLFDMRLSGNLTGLDVFQSVRRLSNMPVIFLSGESRVAEAISALKAGAHDFLLKPVDMSDLFRKIESCFSTRQTNSPASALSGDVRPDMFDRLTAREKEVLQMVLTGQRGNEIARALGITERTVKMHRSNVMKKVNARNLAQLAALYQQYLVRQA